MILLNFQSQGVRTRKEIAEMKTESKPELRLAAHLCFVFSLIFLRIAMHDVSWVWPRGMLHRPTTCSDLLLTEASQCVGKPQHAMVHAL